jgi:hypothetical protein
VEFVAKKPDGKELYPFLKKVNNKKCQWNLTDLSSGKSTKIPVMCKYSDPELSILSMAGEFQFNKKDILNLETVEILPKIVMWKFRINNSQHLFELMLLTDYQRVQSLIEARQVAVGS